MTWLRFEEIKDTGKTKVWQIRSEHDNSILGEVKWYSKWRQYVYTTLSWTSYSTLWNAECLEELADFIKEQMELRKK